MQQEGRPFWDHSHVLEGSVRLAMNGISYWPPWMLLIASAPKRGCHIDALDGMVTGLE